MKSIVSSSLILVLLLALLSPALIGVSVEAQEPAPQLCYGVADNGRTAGSPDQLVSLDTTNQVVVLIGDTGTRDIEAIAFDTDGETLYAADEDQLGTLDLNSGVFTPMPNVIGSGNGSEGQVSFDDVDGLTIDPATGDLYGTHRRRDMNDILIKIDKSTGEAVAGAFGGDDYVVIDSTLLDIDDIAVDPVNPDVMYAASNDGGVGGELLILDPTNGTTTLVGLFNVDDIEGIAFFTNGQLFGSTGNDAPTDTKDRVYTIDKTTGSVTNDGIPFNLGEDYEALGCLTEPTSVGLSSITASGGNGMVFNLSLLLGLVAVAGLTTIVIWRRSTPALEP